MAAKSIKGSGSGSGTSSNSGSDTDDSSEILIEKFRTRKLVRRLESITGTGTSMITLIIKAGEMICKTQSMLLKEYGTATNIKGDANRESVMNAITMARQAIKPYTCAPRNGLVVYCGGFIGAAGKSEKINLAFTPYKPVNTSMYLCDKQFDTAPLTRLMVDDKKIGFIIVDGNGTLFGTLCGTTRKVLLRYDVSLPGKTRRGGQSAARINRICQAKRQLYADKMAELANEVFIDPVTCKCNVFAIIMAGKANFKQQVRESSYLKAVVQANVKHMLDIAYGDMQGFQAAINLAIPVIGDMMIANEQLILTRLLTEMSTDSGKFCIGVEEAFEAVKLGALGDLIVYEHMNYYRYVYRPIREVKETKVTGSADIKLVKEAKSGEVKEVKNAKVVKDVKVELILWGDDSDKFNHVPGYELRERESLMDWLTENYRTLGIKLHIVSDSSTDGMQLRKGLGGIAGLLRYKVDMYELVKGARVEYFGEEVCKEKVEVDNTEFNADDFI
jgi:peptide chain release factor subunit 1